MDPGVVTIFTHNWNYGKAKQLVQLIDILNTKKMTKLLKTFTINLKSTLMETITSQLQCGVE